MSDSIPSNQQCKHWRYVVESGRVLKAEYANKGCTYCDLERANADFRELLLTNGRIAERNLSLSAELARLRAALGRILNLPGWQYDELALSICREALGRSVDEIGERK